MENELKIFENEAFGKVRVIEKNNEPWFVGKDVAEVLGYSQSAKAIREHVKDTHKGVSEMDTPGGRQQIIIIDEAGLYSMVMRSKLPSAEEFQEWIVAEVIPSIRKTGSYSKPMSPLEVLAAQAQALVEQDRKLKALNAKVDGMKNIIGLRPDGWRKDSQALISKMSVAIAGDYSKIQELREKSYELLDERMGVDLRTRLANKRNRMAGEGVCKTKRDRANVLDVIADDKKLIEGYVAIVKEMSVKYGVCELKEALA